jgi:hypothetical protein
VETPVNGLPVRHNCWQTTTRRLAEATQTNESTTTQSIGVGKTEVANLLWQT